MPSTIRKLTRDVENTHKDKRLKATLRQPMIPAGTLIEIDEWDDDFMGKVVHLGTIKIHPRKIECWQDKFEKVGIREELYAVLMAASEPVAASTFDEIRLRDLHHYSQDIVAALLDSGKITWEEVESIVNAKRVATELACKE